MIKLVIFDFDGVIINEYVKHYEIVRKRITGLTEEEFKQLFDGNVHAEIKKFAHRDTGYSGKIEFDKHKATILIQPEIGKCLRLLSKKYILGVISSAKESGAEICLKNSKLEGVFSFNYGFETHDSKIEKFKMALEKYHLKPNQCIFVTDTVGDILEARKVGIESIAIDFGYHSRERLQKVNPIKIISSFSDLNKAIEELSTRQNSN